MAVTQRYIDLSVRMFVSDGPMFPSCDDSGGQAYGGESLAQPDVDEARIAGACKRWVCTIDTMDGECVLKVQSCGRAQQMIVWPDKSVFGDVSSSSLKKSQQFRNPPVIYI
jgi:hypothetical protein